MGEGDAIPSSRIIMNKHIGRFQVFALCNKRLLPLQIPWQRHVLPSVVIRQAYIMVELFPERHNGLWPHLVMPHECNLASCKSGTHQQGPKVGKIVSHCLNSDARVIRKQCPSSFTISFLHKYVYLVVVETEIPDSTNTHKHISHPQMCDQHQRPKWITLLF